MAPAISRPAADSSKLFFIALPSVVGWQANARAGETKRRRLPHYCRRRKVPDSTRCLSNVVCRKASRGGVKSWSRSRSTDAGMPLRKKRYTAEAKGPLQGVRVLDLARLFAGNVLTQVLGDYGAEVIKVEPPAGDTLRAWKTKGVSTHWKVYARNKKSLCLELRKPEARDIVLRLVASSAIFVESFRPGTLEAMGLGPERLLEKNPKLVVVRISGWGQDGPYCRRPGFGSLIEGMSGFAAINGFADREPVLPPMYLADGFAGLFGVSAALIALREAQ